MREDGRFPDVMLSRPVVLRFNNRQSFGGGDPIRITALVQLLPEPDSIVRDVNPQYESLSLEELNWIVAALPDLPFRIGSTSCAGKRPIHDAAITVSRTIAPNGTPEKYQLAYIFDPHEDPSAVRFQFSHDTKVIVEIGSGGGSDHATIFRFFPAIPLVIAGKRMSEVTLVFPDPVREFLQSASSVFSAQEAES
jgi:hypothetical protein